MSHSLSKTKIKKEPLDDAVKPKKKSDAPQPVAFKSQVTTSQTVKDEKLSKFKYSTKKEKREALRQGKVKLYKQSIRMNNMTSVLANKCVIRGNNNRIIGSDNYLIGIGNSAVGDNNIITEKMDEKELSGHVKIKKEKTDETVVIDDDDDGAANQTVSSAMARVLIDAVETAEANAINVPDDDEVDTNVYADLPSDWKAVNGVVLYKPEDIKIYIDWLLATMTIGFRACTLSNIGRHMSIEDGVLLGATEAMQGVIARNRVPGSYDKSQAVTAVAAATQYKRVIVNPDGTCSPASSAAPQRTQPQPIPQSSATASTSTTQTTSTSRIEARPPPTNESDSLGFKIPRPGDNPDDSPWKLCLADLEEGEGPEALSGEPTCVICMTSTREILFAPCMHQCCCRVCSKGLLQNQSYGEETSNGKKLMGPRCPMCRKIVQASIKPFSS